MSLPKSKMISASKALLALAKAKYNNDDSCRAIQNQTVTVNVQQHPTVTATSTPASVITNTQPRTTHQPSSFSIGHQEPSVEEPNVVPIVERDVTLDDEPNDLRIDTTTPVEPIVDTTSKDYYEELDNLHSLVNNYETVAKALLLVIELLQSNPLKLNKIIIPTEPAFKELIMVLTGADDVEIRYSEDIACGISSRKYRVIEDIIVVKDQEPKSLKYAHPDVIRLFDKFNISIKMLAKHG